MPQQPTVPPAPVRPAPVRHTLSIPDPLATAYQRAWERAGVAATLAGLGVVGLAGIRWLVLSGTTVRQAARGDDVDSLSLMSLLAVADGVVLLLTAVGLFRRTRAFVWLALVALVLALPYFVLTLFAAPTLGSAGPSAPMAFFFVLCIVGLLVAVPFVGLALTYRDPQDETAAPAKLKDQPGPTGFPVVVGPPGPPAARGDAER